LFFACLESWRKCAPLFFFLTLFHHRIFFLTLAYAYAYTGPPPHLKPTLRLCPLCLLSLHCLLWSALPQPDLSAFSVYTYPKKDVFVNRTFCKLGALLTAILYFQLPCTVQYFFPAILACLSVFLFACLHLVYLSTQLGTALCVSLYLLFKPAQPVCLLPVYCLSASSKTARSITFYSCFNLPLPKHVYSVYCLFSNSLS
jgi:hypothetical protein